MSILCSGKTEQVHTASSHVFQEHGSCLWPKTLSSIHGQLNKRQKLLGEHEKEKDPENAVLIVPLFNTTNSL